MIPFPEVGDIWRCISGHTSYYALILEIEERHYHHGGTCYHVMKLDTGQKVQLSFRNCDWQYILEA